MAEKKKAAPSAAPSPAGDKKKALETAIAQIEKNYGKGAIMRLGFKLAGTPRHADIVVVSGPITAQSKDRELRTIEQVPDPKVIVTLGSCPRSCNVFKGSYSVVGPLDKYVDIDVSIAGCAPKPEAIIDGLALATQILKEKRGAKE